MAKKKALLMTKNAIRRRLLYRQRKAKNKSNAECCNKYRKAKKKYIDRKVKKAKRHWSDQLKKS